LSVSAPRAWQQVARKESLADYLAQPQARRYVPLAITAEPLDAEPIVQREPVAPQYTAVKLSDEELQLENDRLVDELTSALAEVPEAPVAAQSEPDRVAAVGADEPAGDVAAAEKVERLPAVNDSQTQLANAAPADDSWPTPVALIEQLALLESDPVYRVWAAQARGAIAGLCELPLTRHVDRESALDRIESIVKDAPPARAQIAVGTARQAAQARFAIERRLPLWRASSQTLAQSSTRPVALATARMVACVDGVKAATERSEQGPAWREYLLVDSLRRACLDRDGSADRRRLARKVLARLRSGSLSQEQRGFVRSTPVVALRDELELWASKPTNPIQLLRHLEDFEQEGLASDARVLTAQWRHLRRPLTPQPASDPLDTYYRNANLRIAIAGSLVNQLIPQPEAAQAPVYDTIVGVPVRGRSTTFTKVAIELLPDESNLRMGMEASGVVASNTSSSSGPATLHANGQSSFSARKLMVVDRRGLRVWPAVADVDAFANDLVSVQTDFDGVPLVGSFVRNMARARHAEARGEARWEVEQKVASRARFQLDEQVDPRLEEMISRAHDRIMAPIENLDLEMEPIALTTTKERMVMRLRLAGDRQLGGHTARPQAPSNSVFSLQLHDSAINNTIEKLDLEGRTFTLAELYKHLADKLKKPELAGREDLPDDVQVTFAAQDAVRVRLARGQMEVSMSFAALKQQRRRWRDFTVRTYYRAEAHGLDARFVRDGSVQLDGESLGGAQLVLRSIFSKVLSRERQWSLIDPKFTADPKLAHLEVTQLMIEDGWVGLAYAERRQRANIAERKEPDNAGVWTR